MFGARGRVGENFTHTITEGSHVFFSDTFYGYFENEAGSISPGTVNGSNLEVVAYADDNGGIDFFAVHITGNKAQNFFQGVFAEHGKYFATADVDSYSYVGGNNYTAWYWTDGGAGLTIPAEWDGSGAVRVMFF